MDSGVMAVAGAGLALAVLPWLCHVAVKRKAARKCRVDEIRRELEQAHYSQDAAMHEADYWRDMARSLNAENIQLRNRIDALMVEYGELCEGIR